MKNFGIRNPSFRIEGEKTLPRRGETQTLGHLARDEHSPQRIYLAPVFAELGFRQEINHITAHCGFPVQAVGLVEDDPRSAWVCSTVAVMRPE